MKVQIINGSPNKSEGGTQRTIDFLTNALKKYNNIEIETLYLQDHGLPYCDGCLECLKKGDQYCTAVEKIKPVETAIRNADAVIIGSPVHSFNVSSQIKTMIDLLVKEIHRPSYFGKKAIVVAAANGGGQHNVLRYLRNTMRLWGMDVVGRLGAATPQIGKPAYDEKLRAACDKLAGRLIEAVKAGREPGPSLIDLISFQVMRLVVEINKDDVPLDHNYWKENKWLHADYYNDPKINPMKNILAKFVGRIIRRQIETGKSKPIS